MAVSVMILTVDWRKFHNEELHDLYSYINLLKMKRNLLYIRNQSVPRSKHFPPRL